MHDRLAAGSEPAAGEADGVTQLAEGSVVVEGFGRTGLPNCFERSVKASESSKYGRMSPRPPWLDDDDSSISPKTALRRSRAGNPNRRATRIAPRAAPAGAAVPLPGAADPGPMNPEDNRRLSVYPQVEVEPTANVCPSGPSRDAGDQGRDGRVIWAGSRSEPARQGRGRGRSFDSGHGNGPPAHPRKGPPASMAQSCRDARTAGTPPAPSDRCHHRGDA